MFHNMRCTNKSTSEKQPGDDEVNAARSEEARQLDRPEKNEVIQERTFGRCYSTLAARVNYET